MKMKKAMTVQFNWILILVAGAVILIFFFSIVQKQRQISETKLDYAVKTRFSSILTSAEQSSGTVFSVTIPKKELQFDCEGYSIGSLEPIQLGASFSPETISSITGDLLIFVLDWNMPFKVMNFVYLTSPEVRYVIVQDNDNLWYRLYEALPDNITKEYTADVANIPNTNNYKTRLIYFNEQRSNIEYSFPLNIERGEVTAVNIKPKNPSNSLDGYGEVEFYERGNSNSFTIAGTSYYLGKASLIGAVFSDRIDNYQCSMQRAFEKLNLTASVYAERTDALDTSGKVDNICKTYYDKSVPKTIAEEAGKLEQSLDGARIKEIYDKSVDFRNMNKALQLKSCPLVY